MKLLKILSWTAVHTAWMTMTFSPVALGVEAEKLSKQKIQEYLQEAGLNKQTTVGEFWEKTKAYYPGYVYSQIEAFAMQNKNVRMPEINLTTAKATDGSEVPVLNYTAAGKNYSIQLYGDKNKWAKFNNVNFAAADIAKPEDMFRRIQANDIRVKRDLDLIKKKTIQDSANETKRLEIFKKDFARFKGFPRVTPELWKSLTKEKRANYLVKMRSLWLAAGKVLETKAFVGTYEPNPMEQFYKAIFGQTANAQDEDSNPFARPKKMTSGKVQVQGATVVSNGVKVNIPTDAKSCIVAGYIGAKGIVSNSNGDNRQGCSIDIALGFYKNTPGLQYVENANQTCREGKGPTYRACNPMIYGYPGGSEKCVDSKATEFQGATTMLGPCDTASPLSITATTFTKDYSNIMPAEKRIALMEKDQAADDFKMTRDYVNGVLAKNNPSMVAMLKDGKWNVDLDNELVRIQSHFEDGINQAVEVCEAQIKAGQIVEKQQKAACDQLHRRWLFTEKLIADLRSKACVDGSKYIGAYDDKESSSANAEKAKLNKTTTQGVGLCQCTDGKKVNFGQACSDLQRVTITACKEGWRKDDTGKCFVPPVVEKSCPDVANFKAGEKSDTCVCKNDPEKQMPTGTSPEQGQSICKEDNDAWKWILGIGIGVVALLWFKNRHTSPPIVVSKPPLCDANKKMVGKSCICKVSCPNQNPDSCACRVIPTPTCPFGGTYPACACEPKTCTPGQQIYNNVTCQCDDKPKPVTCPDGSSAPNNNLSQCPKCSDGSYTPIGGCPTGPKNEGGSGDNCPQGGCNGGVPTGH